jgi:U3 small nucleolar RNA-associated protein 14
VTITDAGTKAAVAEQLQIGEALRRKIEGHRPGSDSDDEDGGTGSDDSGTGSDGELEEEGIREDGGLGRKGKSRTRSAALEILAGGRHCLMVKEGNDSSFQLPALLLIEGCSSSL